MMKGQATVELFAAVLVILNILWLIITRKVMEDGQFYFADSTIHFNNFFKEFVAFLFIGCLLFFILSKGKLDNGQLKRFAIRYYLLVFSLMSLSRVFFFLVRKKYRSFFRESLNTIIIGGNMLFKYVFSNLDIKANLGIHRSAMIDVSKGEEGMFQDIAGLIGREKQIENIIFCDDSFSREFYEKVEDIAAKNMIRVYIIPNFRHQVFNIRKLEIYNGIPVIRSLSEPLNKPGRKMLKRGFDVVFSLFVIVFVLSWLVPLLAVLIKIESRGPVFFSQERSGLKNNTFKCLKFRSMVVNRQADKTMATKDDARVTGIGGFLRRTSIDELPQFFNVLMGDMSVVGPRPHMVSQTDLYGRKLDRYMVRHMVKPGITGWAQVTGARGEIQTTRDMKKRVRRDIWYIQNWSFFLDLKIIFLTVFNIFKGDKQAY